MHRELKDWSLATEKEKYEEYVKCSLDPVYFIDRHGVAFNAVVGGFGPIECYEYQKRVINQYLENAWNIILKSRQCLKADTPVDTPSGPKFIQDLREGDKVFSYNLKEGRMEVDTVYDAWCSGDRQCVKFKLQDTRNFEVGENHPFYVKGKGFVKAQDLVRGDEILDDNIGFGTIAPLESEVKLLAYLITDGSTKRQVKFTNNNLNYLTEFEDSIHELFPQLHVRHAKKLNGFDYLPGQKHGVNTLNPVMEWCETKNIAGKLTEEKSLPPEVFDWDRKSITLLINRMFAGDGWISIMNKRGNKRLELGIASPNLEFMHQVKSLLNKFNIRSNIYEVKNMKLQKNRFFKLRVTHSKSVARFIHQIGIYDKIRPEHFDIIKNAQHNVKDGTIIKKVEKTSVQKCYDISVDKNENFFVDGLLTHNTGLSVITAAYVAWRLMFRSNERILILANNGKGAKRFLSYVKTFIDALPMFLQPMNGSKEGRVKWNDTRIEFSNMSWAESVAASPQAGRGEQLSLVILDEFAFVENDKTIWTAINFALSMSKGDCIMISTPYGSGNKYHENWVEAEKGRGGFNPIKVHWTENPVCNKGLRQTIEKGKMVFWSPWYEDQRQKMNYDSVLIAQELDLSFLGSKLLAVDETILSEYREKINKNPPVEWYFDHTANAFTKLKNEFWVWKKPEVHISPDGKKIPAKYIVSCLPEGEKVMTDSGLKNVEDIELTDRLVDKNGDLTEVKNIQITDQYSGSIVTITPVGSFRTTTFTDSHPIWSSTKHDLRRNYDRNHSELRFNERFFEFDFKFNEASQLNEGDWLEIPNRYKGHELSLSDIVNIWNANIQNIRYDFEMQCPLLDPDVWWFIGMWLAEGWTNKNGYAYKVTTAHNVNEIDYLEKIARIWEKYGRTVLVCDKGHNAATAQFTSKQVFTFLNNSFGKYANGKKIPEWVKYIPDNFKIRLIQGYLEGDGCWFKDGRRGDSKMSFVSVSLELLEGIQDILYSVGVISSLNRLRKPGKTRFVRKGVSIEYSTKETYTLVLHHHDSIELANIIGYEHDFVRKNNRTIKDAFFSKDGLKIYLRIQKIDRKLYGGTVYNFETGTHTFACRNIVTHNCDVARGDGKDYSAIQVIQVDTLEQVAEYQGKIDPDLFANMIYAIGVAYNTAFVVVEGNSFGLATTYKLTRQLQYDKNQIFYSKSTKKIHVRPSGYEDYVVDEDEKIPGFQTTYQSKVMVVDAIRRSMREGSVKINSVRLLNEFNTWVMENVSKEKVVAEAESGYNDDLIMALGIGLYIRETEYSNIVVNRELTRSMLDAFSTSSTPMYGKQMSPEEKKSEDQKIREARSKNRGLFYFKNGQDTDGDDDPNDLSWLMG